MAYEKFYPGGWQSGESGGTPITPEALNHIEKGIEQAYSDFAPAGYGLGGFGSERKVTSTEQLDELQSSGWFAFVGGGTDPIVVGSVRINYAGGRVDMYSSDMGKMTIFPVSPSYDSTIVRYFRSGTWGDLEWENPPMVLGVEYRTTKRWQGRPIFTMAVDCGALPASTTKTSTFTVANLERILSGTVSNSQGDALPYVTSTSNYQAAIGKVTNGFAVTITTNIDKSAYTAIAAVEYIKTTD